MIPRKLTGLRSQFDSVCKRFVVVPASTASRRRRRSVRSVRGNVSVEDLELDKPLNLDNPRELDFKLRQLREFTKNLTAQIRMADDEAKIKAAERELPDSSDDTETAQSDFAQLILGKNERSDYKESHHALPGGDDLSSIILSTSNQAKKFLPSDLLLRIGDDELVLRSLINHRNRDWNAIISKLYNCPDRLDGISQRTLKKHLLPRVSRLSIDSIRMLDAMLMSNINGDVTDFTTAMYESLLQNLSDLNLSPATKPEDRAEIYALIDTYFDRFDAAQKLRDPNPTTNGSEVVSTPPKAEMTQFILNCCLKTASKLMDPAKMNYYLTKFSHDYKILPNKENYTCIAQFYTKLGLNSQAWDVFDTMKFLSTDHKPDAKTYTTMLALCNKEKNYSKAIDLFNEMIDLKVEPTKETINALAKTLAVVSGDPIASEGKAESLRLLGWKYLHQNEDLMSIKDGRFDDTIISMMALCAYDGDAGLARALYFKYIMTKFKENFTKWQAKQGSSGSVNLKAIWAKTFNPYLLNYLMLAYANYSPTKLPLLLGFDQGATTRRNLMSDVDFTYKFANDEGGPQARLPMLPLSDINHPTQVLLESRAVWQFNLEFGGTVDLRAPPKGSREAIEDILATSESKDDFSLQILHQIALWKSKSTNYHVLNHISLMTFLTIPLKLGDMKEFVYRMEEFSYEQQTLDKHLLSLYETKSQNLLPEMDGSSQSDDTRVIRQEDGIKESVKFLSSMKHKILRDSSVYELAMKAATKFNDTALATRTWESRGAYRKTWAFQNLDRTERAKKDALFASLMVEFFTLQGMLTDAMGIIMGSQRHITWTYAMVKKLHRKLVEFEDKNSIRILLEIVNKGSKSRS